MRNILEITTFHTPIDSLEVTEYKELQIRMMIEDFIINSSELFEKMERQDSYYESTRFVHKHVILTIGIKKNSEMENYLLPHCDIKVELDEKNLNKEAIEDFLNTIIRFFSGTLTGEYFIEYDNIYNVDTMNQGKKYSIEVIKEIDVNNLNTKKNKNLLDAILHLHYTLNKQILALGIEQIDLDKYLEESIESASIRDALMLGRKRVNITTESLFTNIQILHKQIQVVLSYFINKP